MTSGRRDGGGVSPAARGERGGGARGGLRLTSVSPQGGRGLVAELAAAELSSRQGEGRERRAGPVLRGHPGKREGGSRGAGRSPASAAPRARLPPDPAEARGGGPAGACGRGADRGPGEGPDRAAGGVGMCCCHAGSRLLRGSVDGDIATRAGRACACSVAFWCVISCP